ncbi:MAG: AAA family ATPase [Thaumarchaeota archaeon]|nr:AAA family ATPase [Candidatus Geocrenenecus arthurdayi]
MWSLCKNMFTKTHVENFLSLRNVDIELKKTNIFIGPNTSGKSNIAKVFQLIARNARDGIPVLEGYKEFKDISFSFNPAAKINITLEVSIKGVKWRYILELSKEKYSEHIYRADELVMRHDGDLGTIYIHAKGHTAIGSTGQVSAAYYGRNIYKSILTSLPLDIEAEGQYLAFCLKNISAHSFSPTFLRLENPVNEKPLLKYHGENLARYLLYLYTERRKDFRRIEETLQRMVPEVEEITPHIEGTNVEIWIRVKGLDEPLKPHNISDGTLRILAMISALHGGFSLVVLEEPENCIHPYLLETLMDLVRNSPSQVVITTHSPYLLDHAKPEEVFLVEKEGLETKVKMLSTTEEMNRVKLFLEEGGTLGEAWYSGIIGGIP